MVATYIELIAIATILYICAVHYLLLLLCMYVLIMHRYIWLHLDQSRQMVVHTHVFINIMIAHIIYIEYTAMASNSEYK